tara:strand:- start:1119 stop:2417 length:1299 start_codon:yes stop_codon:yes gene_type:complete
MPKALKKKLYKRAKKKFPSNKKLQDRYVYGTLNKLNNGGSVDNNQNNKEPDEYKKDLQDVQSFYKNYILTPKYRERLESSGYENVDKTIQSRLKGLEDIQMDVYDKYKSPGSNISQGKFMDIYKTDFMGYPDFYPKYTIAHEAGHAMEYRVDKNRGLNIKDRMAMEDRNQLYRDAPDAFMTNIGDYYMDQDSQTIMRPQNIPFVGKSYKEGAKHDLGSPESYADLTAMRMYLKDKHNISPEEDITKEKWKEVLKGFDSDDEYQDTSIKRFFKKYGKPEDATDILNNIAMEETLQGDYRVSKNGAALGRLSKLSKRKKLNNISPKKKMFTAIDGSKHPTAEQRDGYNKSLKQARIELAKEKVKKDVSSIMKGKDPVSRAFQETALLALTGGAGNFILSKARHAKKIPKIKKTIRGVDNISDADDIVKSVKRKK